jgi:hypothetical protein
LLYFGHGHVTRTITTRKQEKQANMNTYELLETSNWNQFTQDEWEHVLDYLNEKMPTVNMIQNMRVYSSIGQMPTANQVNKLKEIWTNSAARKIVLKDIEKKQASKTDKVVVENPITPEERFGGVTGAALEFVKYVYAYESALKGTSWSEYSKEEWKLMTFLYFAYLRALNHNIGIPEQYQNEFEIWYNEIFKEKIGL